MSAEASTLRVLLVGAAARSLTDRLAARFSLAHADAEEAEAALLADEPDVVVSADADLLGRLLSTAPAVAPCLVVGAEGPDLEARLELAAEHSRRARKREAWSKHLADEALELTFTVVHDLKGQLQGVVGLSGLLMEVEGEHLSNAGLDWCRRLEETGERLAALAEGAVEILRASRAEPDLRELRLDELVPEVLALAASNAAPREVLLTFDEGLPEVMGDRRMLHAALSQLVDNALIHNPRPRARGHVAWSASDARRVGVDGGVTLSLADNGPGIASEELERVFEPFYRARRDPAEEPPGAGVGLALVRKIAERHGGVVWAESEPSAGATFYFYLPPSPKG